MKPTRNSRTHVPTYSRTRRPARLPAIASCPVVGAGSHTCPPVSPIVGAMACLARSTMFNGGRKPTFHSHGGSQRGSNQDSGRHTCRPYKYVGRQPAPRNSRTHALAASARTRRLAVGPTPAYGRMASPPPPAGRSETVPYNGQHARLVPAAGAMACLARGWGGGRLEWRLCCDEVRRVARRDRKSVV